MTHPDTIPPPFESMRDAYDALERAAGPCAETWHKGRLELALDGAEGTAEPMPTGEVSIELHGLTREQACRVLRALSLGSILDPYLDRAESEAAPWTK